MSMIERRSMLPNRLWRTVGLMALIGLLTLNAGCRRIFTMSNSMCPPQIMSGQTQVQNAQAFMPVTQGYMQQQPAAGYVQPNVIQPNVPHYAAMQQASQQLAQTVPVPTDDRPTDSMPPTPPSVLSSKTSTDADAKKSGDFSMSAMVEVVGKLKETKEENARLREKLTEVQEDNRRKEKLAKKATEFAERLRNDNVQLKSDLQTWEERLLQLETLFETRQSRQEDVLVDIETQLEDLIAEYESDQSSTTTIQTSIP